MRSILALTLIILLLASTVNLPLQEASITATAQTQSEPVLLISPNCTLTSIAVLAEPVNATYETVHMYTGLTTASYDNITQADIFTIHVYEYYYYETTSGPGITPVEIFSDSVVYGVNTTWPVASDIAALQGNVVYALYMDNGMVHVWHSASYGAPGTWISYAVNLSAYGISFGTIVSLQDLYLEKHLLGIIPSPKVYVWPTTSGTMILLSSYNGIWLYDPSTGTIGALLYLDRINNTGLNSFQPGDLYYLEQILVDVLPYTNDSVYALVWRENATWVEDASGNLVLSKTNTTSIIRVDLVDGAPVEVNMTSIPGNTPFSRLNMYAYTGAVGMLTNATGQPGLLSTNGTIWTPSSGVQAPNPLPVYLQYDYMVVSGILFDPTTNTSQFIFDILGRDPSTGTYTLLNETTLLQGQILVPVETQLVPGDYGWSQGSLGYYEAVELTDMNSLWSPMSQLILVNFPLNILPWTSAPPSQPSAPSVSLALLRDQRLLELNSTVVSYRPLAAASTLSWNPSVPGYSIVTVVRVENVQTADTGLAVVAALLDANGSLVWGPGLVYNSTLTMDPYDALVVPPGYLYQNLTIIFTGADTRGYGVVYAWEMGAQDPVLLVNTTTQTPIVDAEMVYAYASTSLSTVELALLLENMSVWHLVLDSQAQPALNKTTGLTLPTSGLGPGGSTWNIVSIARWALTGTDLSTIRNIQPFYAYALIYNSTTNANELALIEWDVYYSDFEGRLINVTGPSILTVAGQNLASQTDTAIIVSVMSPNPLDNTSRALVSLYTNTTSGTIIGTGVAVYDIQPGTPPALVSTYNKTGILPVSYTLYTDTASNSTLLLFLGGYSQTGLPPLQPAIIDPFNMTPIAVANSTAGIHIILFGFQLANGTLILYEAGHSSPWTLLVYRGEQETPTPIPEPWIAPLIALAGGAIYLLTRRPRR